MNAAERRRRIRAGRPSLIADLGALRVQGVTALNTAKLLRMALDPNLKFADFQMVRRTVSSYKKYGFAMYYQ